MTERGYFVISDITGYTAFLTKAELEHAEDILRSLITALLEETKPPLIFAKLEGDAIFAYAPQSSILQGQTLLEMVENLYGHFRATLENTRLNTTCTCNACTLIPSLDLKFVIHYGEYIAQKIGSVRELQGVEVITVHRLLKNTIKETTGCEAYAFFSDAAVKALGLEEIAASMIRHQEQYEHVGEVPGYVHDLRPVWQRQREARRVFIDPDSARFAAESPELPVPPSILWDYLTRPDLKVKWMGVKGVTAFKRIGGRQGPGSEQHCAHDGGTSIWKIVDWKPFEYHTLAWRFMGADGLETIICQPTEGGTIVIDAVQLLPEANPLKRLIRPALHAIFRLFMANYTEQKFPLLAELIQADIAAGAISAQFEPAPPVEQIVGKVTVAAP